MPPETKLEKAERYVREGEEHVATQKSIVAGQHALGHNTRESRALLEIFEDSLAGHKENLTTLKATG